MLRNVVLASVFLLGCQGLAGAANRRLDPDNIAGRCAKAEERDNAAYRTCLGRQIDRAFGGVPNGAKICSAHFCNYKLPCVKGGDVLITVFEAIAVHMEGAGGCDWLAEARDDLSC